MYHLESTRVGTVSVPKVSKAQATLCWEYMVVVLYRFWSEARGVAGVDEALWIRHPQSPNHVK